MERLKARLKICQWNANDVTGRKKEITVFLEENKIDVMLLSKNPSEILQKASNPETTHVAESIEISKIKSTTRNYQTETQTT